MPKEAIDIAGAAAALADLRERRPLVQNITNYVAMTFSANVLLALGASPAMVHAAEEVEDFIAISSGLVINIGTLSPRWVEAMTPSAEAGGQRSASPGCSTRSAAARRLTAPTSSVELAELSADDHPRQRQRDHEPCRRRRRRRQGRRFDGELRRRARRRDGARQQDRRRRRRHRQDRLRHRRQDASSRSRAATL